MGTSSYLGPPVIIGLSRVSRVNCSSARFVCIPTLVQKPSCCISGHAYSYEDNLTLLFQEEEFSCHEKKTGILAKTGGYEEFKEHYVSSKCGGAGKVGKQGIQAAIYITYRPTQLFVLLFKVTVMQAENSSWCLESLLFEKAM